MKQHVSDIREGRGGLEYEFLSGMNNLMSPCTYLHSYANVCMMVNRDSTDQNILFYVPAKEHEVNIGCSPYLEAEGVFVVLSQLH